MHPKNPNTSKITQTLLKSTQKTKKGDNNGERKIFITNIIKGHKITDLTRPNELGTTTS
jgi:hypothetical protein